MKCARTVTVSPSTPSPSKYCRKTNERRRGSQGWAEMRGVMSIGRSIFKQLHVSRDHQGCDSQAEEICWHVATCERVCPCTATHISNSLMPTKVAVTSIMIY